MFVQTDVKGLAVWLDNREKTLKLSGKSVYNEIVTGVTINQ